MKTLKFLFLSVLISISGVAYAQNPNKKATEVQPQKNITPNQQKKKNNNIKTVPKARLKQSQLKKANQSKSKLQSKKLKKAIRKSNIKRKPFRR